MHRIICCLDRFHVYPQLNRINRVQRLLYFWGQTVISISAYQVAQPALQVNIQHQTKNTNKCAKRMLTVVHEYFATSTVTIMMRSSPLESGYRCLWRICCKDGWPKFENHKRDTKTLRWHRHLFGRRWHCSYQTQIRKFTFIAVSCFNAKTYTQALLENDPAIISTRLQAVLATHNERVQFCLVCLVSNKL